MPIPRLLYHNTSPPLYPDGNSTHSVLAIRFPSPVRVQSIRLIPEGVGTLNGGVGCTYPAQFRVRALFNTFPSDPINALAGSVIEYDGREGWEQDVEVGMPEGVGTRLVVLSGGFERLSLSIYGYGGSGDHDEGNWQGRMQVEEQEAVTLRSDGRRGGRGMQDWDWGWVSDWAGGISGILDLLDDGIADEAVRERALSCLEILVQTDTRILDQIITHPTALSYLLLLPSYPPQPILQRLFIDPKYALSAEVRHHLPPKHPCRPLTIGSEDERRRAAWAGLPNLAALHVLGEVGLGDLDVDVQAGESRLSTLVRSLEDWKGEKQGFELGLDLLLAGLPEDGAGRLGGHRMKYMARKLPGLIVRSRLNGSDRVLDIHREYRHDILTALLETPPLIDGHPTARVISDLAQPFLPLDPYTSLFDLALESHVADPDGPTTHTTPASPEDRAVARFATSLDRPTLPNAYIHNLTPAQILSAIAPDLLADLSTARDPPLGIPPTLPSSTSSGQASASAFAGKVYTSHEFRTREVLGAGAGPGAGPGPGAAGGTSLAPAATPLGPAGGGLGVNTLRMSRPASRHVDEYAR